MPVRPFAASLHCACVPLCRSTLLLLVLSGLVLTTTAVTADERSREPSPLTRHHGKLDEESGASAAVVVADTPLLHTKQFLPLDDTGKVLHSGATERQFDHVWQQLETLLARHPGAELVKLNLYVAGNDAADTVRKALQPRLKERRRAAVSFVVTRLPGGADVHVALDAVVALPASKPVTGENQDANSVAIHGEQESTVASVMPPGRRVYISGQAEKASGLASATRETLESLDRTLQFLKLDRRRDVVQIKAFLHPMSEVATVYEEVAKFFPSGRIPPVVVVEWESSLPIEIEMIAHGGPAVAEGPLLEYLTPPGMTASPVFSRLARINRGPSLYISGLYGSQPEANEEVTPLFGKLTEILGDTGSDLKHLAKATYYVATDEVSTALNQLRPRYYDPARPPAASKAQVQGVGQKNRNLTIDMIAVPREE